MSTEPTSDVEVPRPRFPVAVVGVAIATGFGMIPVFAGLNLDRMPSAATVSAGWVVLGLAAALLVDRPDLKRVGSVFAVCAVVPAVVGGVAMLQHGDRRWIAFDDLWDSYGWLIVAAALVVIVWSVDRARDRMSRRRLIWLASSAAVLFGAVLATRVIAEDRRAAVVTMVALWTFAAAATRILLARDLRPIVEPVVDAALIVAAVSVSAALGLGALAAGRWSGLPSPEASGAFVAVATAALSWPLAIWMRRTFVEGRYGRGTLTPDDVAAITAGLHREADLRELLTKAAELVAAASGHKAVNIARPGRAR